MRELFFLLEIRGGRVLKCWALGLNRSITKEQKTEKAETDQAIVALFTVFCVNYISRLGFRFNKMIVAIESSGYSA